MIVTAFFTKNSCPAKTFLPIVFCVFTAAANSQMPGDIVAKYIEFTGGSAAWKKVKTITSAGTYNYGGVEFPFIAYSKAPALYKYIVTFNGKSFEQAYDGKNGWRIDGFKNEKQKTILTGHDAFAMANESDVELESPFIDYNKKGHIIQFQGKDTVNGKVCYKIKLSRKNIDTATYFFSTGNYALIKKQAIAKNTELEKDLLDIFFDDYRSIGGLVMPHTITYRSGPQTVLIITVNEIKLDLPIQDEIFKP